MGKNTKKPQQPQAGDTSTNKEVVEVVVADPASQSATPATDVTSSAKADVEVLETPTSHIDSNDEESVEEMEGGEEEEEEEVDKNKFKLDDGSIIDYSQTPDEQAIIDANAAAEEMFNLRRAEELEIIQQEEEKARTEKGIPILDFRAKYEDEKVNGKKYHLITWEQLKRVFCYERVAHGFMIAGDISQKHTQHWDRSKQIKVRDHDCKVEGAIFFYDENAPEPHFSWDKVEVGNYVEIKSPRLHKFMDGQDGLRVEDNSQIATIRKRSFTEEKRFEYGKLNKENGNSKYLRAVKMLQDIEEEEEEKRREKLLSSGPDGKKKKKGDGGEAAPNAAFRSVSAGNRMLDDAIVSYEMAITHLECTFTAFSAEQRLEVRKVLASCFLNVAACQIALKKWDTVEMPCDKALSINASKQLNAKAYYRIAQAMLELGTPRRMAEDKLKRAQTILLPESDPAINALIHKIAVMDYEEKQQEKIMFRNRREARALAAEKKDGSSNNQPSISTTTTDGNSGDLNTPTSAAATSVPSPFSPNVPSTQSFGLKRSLFGPPPTGLYGVPNFRDLGGLPSNDGKRVTKKFVLYRSNTLCLATSSSSLEGALNEFPDASTPNYSITTTNPPSPHKVPGKPHTAEAELLEDAKMRHMKKDLAFIPPNGLVRKVDIEEPKSAGDDNNDDDASSDDEASKKPVKSTWSMEPFNDLKTLVDDFGIKTIIDFRNEHEARAQVKKLKKLRGGKSGKWFQNYQDLFTTIKVICANDDKSGAENDDAASSSPLSESNDASTATGSSARGPRKVVVGTTINFFKRVFLLLAGGGLQPTPLLDPSATRKRKVWLTIKSTRTQVFQNGLLTTAPDTSKKLSLPTPTEGAGGVNGGKPWSKSDIALQDALVNHPVVFRVDLVTRSLISLSSYWLLFTLAICAIFAQIRLASSIMIKYVVNKQTQKDLFVNILTYQGPEIAHVFSILSEPRNYPVVLSCSLGKDRTGLITALVLAACEVKFEAIMKDFSDRTNESLAYSPFLVEEQRLLGLIPAEWETAKAATLKEVFVFLTMEYGGVLSYLRSIGVTNEQILTMRSLLTRPV